jgi:hypothetical protein
MPTLPGLSWQVLPNGAPETVSHRLSGRISRDGLCRQIFGTYSLPCALRAARGGRASGVESEKSALRGPVQRQVVGPFQPLGGEIGGLPTVEERLDDVGRQEGERQEVSQIRRVQPVPLSELAERTGAVVDELFQHLMGLGNGIDKVGIRVARRSVADY